MTQDVYVGTQSWFYPEWQGVFYDEGATAEQFLSMYAQEFRFVEVDTSFYAAPKIETLEQWIVRTPDHFRFALKVPREITHERILQNVAQPLAQFFARVQLLGPKLGPVLFQLPPRLTSAAANDLYAALAGRPPEVACVVEFRHESWFRPDIFARLDALGTAAAAVDGPFMPVRYAQRIIARATTDFVYIRLLAERGSVERFDHRVFDRAADLATWADVLRATTARTIYLTSSNYYEGFAPETARRFSTAFGITLPQRSIRRQASLFDAHG